MKLMTHLVVGYPNLEISEKLIYTLDKYSEFIELQIPYSDPVADGPVIMNACQNSLDNGIKVEDAFTLAKKVSSKIRASLLFMTYGNIVFKYGIKKFIQNAKKSGVKGFIIPDINPENLKEFFNVSKKENMKILSIIAPTSSNQRIKYLGNFSKDLIYVVSRTGITGEKTSFGEELDTFIKRIKSNYKGKIAMGFGIKEKKDIEFLEGKVEYAVIGSELIRQFDKGGIEGVDKFLKNLIG